MSKYAEGTSVSIERSKAEMEKLLMKYKADQFSSGWTEGKNVVAFRMRTRYIKIELPLAVYGKARTKKNWTMGQDQCDAENRRRWRALILYVKAKLESVESEIVSFEEAFLAHILLPNRQTAGQHMVPQIDAAYSNNKMPSLLPGASS